VKQGILLITFFVLALTAKASHIVGGDMYYDYLGNNNYRVYIVLYRDCASTGAQFDDPLSLGVFDVNNNLVTSFNIPFPGSTFLPVVFNNPCVTPPSGICTERAIYTTVINLPPTPGGYTLSYQRCCRGPNITNLSNPDDTGLTLTTQITGTASNALVNSAPRFVNYPPLVICNNENLFFDHSATDPDGDILTYELVTPNAGATSFNPAPAPPPGPPYGPVIWSGGNSAIQPLGPGSTTTIDPNTGQLFVDANNLGLYVVGIRVNEWRNGVIINSQTRDFLFRVVNCVITLQAEVTEQEDSPGFVSYCQGLTWTFDNQSFGATSYAWNFGDPSTTTDVSTAFEPTYTYPSPGIYQVTLIANPGWPCTDTAVIELTLANPLEVDMIFQDSACFIDHSIDFQSVVTGPPNTNVALQWNFGPNGNPGTSAASAVNGVTFSQPTGNTITLIGSAGICADTVTYPMFFFAPPSADLGFESNHECNGLTQSFLNTSVNGVNYYWDFGVPGITSDVSTQTSPTYTFPSPGTYPITLVAEIVSGCSDTIVEDLTVYEELVVSFTHNDSLCIVNNSFNFVGNVTGPPITTYQWNFGPNAAPSSATTLNVPNVVYNTPGSHNIALTASFLQCSESASSSVFLFKEPTIDFGLVEDLPCAPYLAQFTNNSTADSEIYYYWSFGDGGSSTEETPVHLYQNPGQYSVTLQIRTEEGCVDTLTLTQIGLVVVHPSPVAEFTIDKTRMDICNATVQFTDQSEGALFFEYIFDDAEAGSSDQNPSYTYTTDGTHNPFLIAYNEFGCSDTARRSLFVEPFPIYIPNTFTPDGNEFNNNFNVGLALDPLEWEMRIFNRWGEQVFKTNDPEDYWDGQYNGFPAPDGIYAYKVKYVPCGANQDPVTITGHVNLLR
jgi:gliding motility-associated-like protein